MDTYLGHRTGWRYWMVGPDFTLRSCFTTMGENEIGQWGALKWPMYEAMVSRCLRKCDRDPRWYCTNCSKSNEEIKNGECCAECPQKTTKCGIYIFEHEHEAKSAAGSYSGAIFGTISFWGKWSKNESDEGIVYRARYAYPQKLYGGVCRKCKSFRAVDGLFIVEKPQFAHYLKSANGLGRIARAFSWFFRYDLLTSVAYAPFFVCEEDGVYYRKRGYAVSQARPVFEKVAEKYGIEVAK